MNYRHHFHAGNFADVWKHAILVQLIRGMQKKEKGFLYLDTHAGRGRYDLSVSVRGDSLERKPEFPEGIGRLWNAAALPEALADYVSLVKQFNGPGSDDPLQYYPGSPRLAQLLVRPQDRLALCEKHEEEFSALKTEFARGRRVSVHDMDGYGALRAMLPPLEKRALVLIDPPFEQQDEFARITEALREGLKRMPAATMAVWYPLTERARVDAFFDELQRLALPPCFYAEVMVAGEASPMKMKGCGLLVLNPPWQIEERLRSFLPELARLLEQERGGGYVQRWLVQE
jgi:23S rRNA (adenine2030-N6)-methyltransferase